MKQKSETQCDIKTTQRKIKERKKLIDGAKGAKKALYEIALKELQTRLSILRKRARCL